MKTETIIVGGGLAGCCLGLQLRMLNRPFVMFDDQSNQVSSQVAAGLINPIVFRYLTLSWEAERNLQVAKSFYQQTTQIIGKECFHDLPIGRIFNEKEKDLWERKAEKIPFKTMINPTTPQALFENHIHAPNGFGTVEGGGWLNISSLMDSTKKLLMQSNQLIAKAFDYNELMIMDDGVQYKGVKASEIVFCEGALATKNPFFQFIPFRPVKGEILDLMIVGLSDRMIINKDIFLLPLGDQKFRCGSTYDWDDLSPTPTLKGKFYLEEKLKSFLTIPYENIGHQAGIRPAVADRVPVCGQHPHINRVYILNGLGAKGALFAPYLSIQLAQQITLKAAADPATDPIRFLKKSKISQIQKS